MIFAPELKTHAQKVCSLYKTGLRMIESYYVASFLSVASYDTPGTIWCSGYSYTATTRHVIRYHQVLLRKRFDDNKCICDPKDQRRLLWLGEHEAFMKKHPLPFGKFPKSAGGVSFERVVEPPDWVLDYWHPLEKAQYPEYFKTRECRKCEYIQKWQAGIL